MISYIQSAIQLQRIQWVEIPIMKHAEYQRYVPSDGTSLIRVEDGVLLIGVLCCERNDDGEEASNKKKKKRLYNVRVQYSIFNLLRQFHVLFLCSESDCFTSWKHVFAPASTLTHKT